MAPKKGFFGKDIEGEEPMVKEEMKPEIKSGSKLPKPFKKKNKVKIIKEHKPSKKFAKFKKQEN